MFAIVSHMNTTAQHSAAIPIMFKPLHAAITPAMSAMIPAMGTCGAVMIAGNVMTASVT
jgi:PAB1-binding protein PBP1